MTDTAIQVTGHTAQILQALRAGILSAQEVNERWTKGLVRMGNLIKYGYAERIKDSDYKITALGRANCPNRSATLIALNNQISQAPKMTIDPKKPKALILLEYIEQHPNSTMLQIQSGTGLKELGESYILDYIKKGHVEVGKDLRDKKTYTLTKPLKDFYKGNPAEHPGRKSTRITLPEPNLSIQNELKIPEFLRKNYTPIPEIATAPLQDTFEQARQETKADIQALTKQPAHYRFAFTSDQTLIIFNNEIPMEIDKETTAKLVDFCDSIIRSAIL